MECPGHLCLFPYNWINFFAMSLKSLDFACMLCNSIKKLPKWWNVPTVFACPPTSGSIFLAVDWTDLRQATPKRASQVAAESFLDILYRGSCANQIKTPLFLRSFDNKNGNRIIDFLWEKGYNLGHLYILLLYQYIKCIELQADISGPYLSQLAVLW